MNKTTLYLTGTQSIKLLRAARAGRIVRAIPTDDDHVEPLPASLADIPLGSLAGWLGTSRRNPLQLLVPSRADRRWLSGIATSILACELPPGGFLELVPGGGPDAIRLPSQARILIEAPPLAVLRVAQSLLHEVNAGIADALGTKLRTMAFASECCGSYARDPLHPQTGKCHYDKPRELARFSDPAAMQAFLTELHNLKGLDAARHAARWAIDESGSPMETYINMALTLPPRLAGCSLRQPLANKQLQVEEKTLARLAHGSIRPDLQWPDFKMLAEYLGEDGHAGKPARIEDKNRIQDYLRADYKPFVLMFDDVRSVEALRKTVLMLADEFVRRGLAHERGRVLRLFRDEEFRIRQTKLLHVLLPPVSRQGSASLRGAPSRADDL